jgi:putative Mg2+ transporter-C (MgtC) family protein
MFEQFLGPDHFDIMPHLVAIGLAYLLAFPIGWNREKSERSAGLRTFPLVAVASCGFIQAAESMTADTPEAMARIVEGLITGMGFIGGGQFCALRIRSRAPPRPPVSGLPVLSARRLVLAALMLPSCFLS